jgi:hypothetical protein
VAKQPDPNADPYRTLGLQPGASMAEVKRAHRLLAKAFHPDSAGETAIPRFLAIQAAYDQLRAGRPGAAPRAARAPTPPAAEPWRADPERARAARERARAARAGSQGRARSTSTGGQGTRPTGTGAAGPARGTGPATGTGGAGRTTGSGTSSSGGRGSGRRRDVRKATMGSTSYDEARDPSDATWSGASWYGPSSGEYWIVNPREYADPRKHGPEYQQRARRPLVGEAVDIAAGGRADVAAAEAAAEFAPTGTAASASAAGARPGAASRSASGAAWAPRRPPPDPASGSGWSRPAPDVRPFEAADRYRPGEAPPDAERMEGLAAASRAWLGGPADDPIRRLGLVLVAWPPVGLAAAAVIGDLTGCTSFSAACGGSEPLLPWLAQAVILGLLLLLPPVARLLAGGAFGVLIALVPITAFLLAVGGTGAPQAAPVMAALLAVAWLAGITWTARALRRRGAGAIGARS